MEQSSACNDSTKIHIHLVQCVDLSDDAGKTCCTDFHPCEHRPTFYTNLPLDLANIVAPIRIQTAHRLGWKFPFDDAAHTTHAHFDLRLILRSHQE